MTQGPCARPSSGIPLFPYLHSFRGVFLVGVYSELPRDYLEESPSSVLDRPYRSRTVWRILHGRRVASLEGGRCEVRGKGDEEGCRSHVAWFRPFG